MLAVYTRHYPPCWQKDVYFRRCQCPKWIHGTLWPQRGRIRKSAHTRNWNDCGAPGTSQPSVGSSLTNWLVPRRTATIADLQRGKNAGELRSEAESELLNDAIFGAIYYRLLLRSGPLTRRFGEELVEQVIRGHRSGNARS